MKTETLKKMAYMALGYVIISPEKLKEMAKELAAAGKISETEGHALVDDMIKKFTGVKTDIEKHIEKITHGVVEKLNLSHSEKLNVLGERIASLEKKTVAKLNGLGGGNGAGKTKESSRRGKITKPVAAKSSIKKSGTKKKG